MRICEGNDFDDKISREELVKQYKEYIEKNDCYYELCFPHINEIENNKYMMIPETKK